MKAAPIITPIYGAIVVLAVLLGWLNAGLALLAGLVFAQVVNHPWVSLSRKYSALCLKTSIVGLGFGLSISQIGQTAVDTLSITLGTIVLSLLVGWFLWRAFNLHRDTGILIASGTAICGGSAIAAVSQAIRSRPEHTMMAITVVFILNLVALYLFPLLGKWLALTETQFGLWAALAIHDTSSVVGAATDYGPVALEVATTTKLSRALWIIPLTLIVALTQKSEKKTIAVPIFIVLFIVASGMSSALPDFSTLWQWLYWLAKKLLIVALFLLGLGVSRDMIRSVDTRPLMMGILLWVVIACVSLFLVKSFY